MSENKCLQCKSPIKTGRKYCGYPCANKAQTGEGHHSWKGGRYKTVRGYIRVRAIGNPSASPNGDMYEHRLVMEQVLGRRLKRTEIVHHINGIKTDNRPENLVVTTQSKHAADHQRKKILCSFTGCTLPHAAKGYCRYHYDHFRRNRRRFYKKP